MAAAYRPIDLQRNETYLRDWVFSDLEGNPIDLTGATFEMDVKYAGGDPGAVLASFDIVVADAEGGRITISLDATELAAVPGEMERVTLAYDLLATQNGTPMAIAAGPLNLLPGVS
jgi:hypothetical protein